MPQDPSDKPKRALTHGGPGRHARHSPTAGAPIAYVEDDPTGQFEVGQISADELDQKRHERDARVRERLATLEAKAGGIDELRRDLRTTDKLVDEHNISLKIHVLPVIERTARQLEAIRTAQHELDVAFTAAISTINDSIAEMTLQLQAHAVDLAALKDGQRTHSDRFGVVERTLATHTTELAALTGTRTVDVKVGSWVRRNATSILVTALSAIAGLVGGYLSSHLGVTP